MSHLILSYVDYIREEIIKSRSMDIGIYGHKTPVSIIPEYPDAQYSSITSHSDHSVGLPDFPVTLDKRSDSDHVFEFVDSCIGNCYETKNGIMGYFHHNDKEHANSKERAWSLLAYLSRASTNGELIVRSFDYDNDEEPVGGWRFHRSENEIRIDGFDPWDS